jgi:hypothetical protein
MVAETATANYHPTAPPPSTHAAAAPVAGLAGWLLHFLRRLSAVRNWVWYWMWRSAVVTTGSAEHHGALKTVAGTVIP